MSKQFDTTDLPSAYLATRSSTSVLGRRVFEESYRILPQSAQTVSGSEVVDRLILECEQVIACSPGCAVTTLCSSINRLSATGLPLTLSAFRLSRRSACSANCRVLCLLMVVMPQPLSLPLRIHIAVAFRLLYCPLHLSSSPAPCVPVWAIYRRLRFVSIVNRSKFQKVSNSTHSLAIHGRPRNSLLQVRWAGLQLHQLQRLTRPVQELLSVHPSCAG